MNQPPPAHAGAQPQDGSNPDLRQRAEALWESGTNRWAGASAQPPRPGGEALLHELQVHQIELEMQNEELRLANEALELSRARYVDLYDLAPVGYCSVNAEGMVLKANLTMAALLGIARSDLAAPTPFSNFVCREDQDAWYLLRRRLLDQQTPQRCELRLKCGDSLLWVQLSAAIQPGSGQAPEMLLAVSDISENRKAQQALQEARDAAQAATQAKARFLANMSHEIRTPLSAILGSAELMRRDGLNARQVGLLQRMDVAAQHLLAVIDDILDLTRIEAGRLRLEQQVISVADILHRVQAMVVHQAGSKGLRLEVEDATGPQQSLLGDRTRMVQALMNYAGNAVKFTEQGRITLCARLLEEDASAQLLQFEVADTGPGIPQQDQARLFNAFEQADDASTRSHAGTGLGLALTRELAHRMGGTVGVHSTVGGGSTFWLRLRLPKSAGLQASSAGTAPMEDARAELARTCAGRRLLLVEDDPVHQSLVCELLDGSGLQIELARNGTEALAKLGSARFDAVLMDLQMPGMDGLEASRRMRNLPGLQHLPIVALTANAFAEDRQRCLQAGMTAFLAKPVAADALCDGLLKCLRQSVAAHGGCAGEESAEVRLAREFPGKRVLMVDDREDHRELLRAFLQPIWSHLDSAADGTQALELAARNAYDLILMDVRMQPMNGLEATRQIRALPHGSQLRIVGLTAGVGAEELARCMDAGMDAVLQKAFGPEEPYRTILQCLLRG